MERAVVGAEGGFRRGGIYEARINDEVVGYWLLEIDYKRISQGK